MIATLYSIGVGYAIIFFHCIIGVKVLCCYFLSQPTDPPSAPGLTVTVVDMSTYHFTIDPLSKPSQCITHYAVTPEDKRGSRLFEDIIIPYNGETNSLSHTTSGFDLSYSNYFFTAVAHTLAGEGPRSSESYDKNNPFSEYAELLSATKFIALDV